MGEQTDVVVFNPAAPFAEIDLEAFSKMVIDDTWDRDPPKVGSRWYCDLDEIEILAVSDLLKHPETGMRDRLILFRVGKVFSPEDSSLTNDGECVELMYGDILSMYEPRN